MNLDLLAASWLVALLAAPLAARLALHWGFVDHPAGHKFHDRATPLLGGAALYLGVLPLLLLLRPELAGRRFWAFAAASSLLFLAGLWDDRRRLSVGVKLAVQAVAALALVGGGFRADLPLPDWLAALVSFAWIVGVTNAVNLLDSADGAAAGIAAVASAGFLAIVPLSPLGTGLAAAFLGATLAFLVYNFHPARLFMGDAGSLFLGLGLAALGLETSRGSADASVAWMAPVLLLAVPVFDTTLVSLSRLRRGKNPMTHPGKDHFAHRLARRGLGVRRAVAGLYLLGILGGFLAWCVRHGSPGAGWGIGAAAALAAAAGIAWLDRPIREGASSSAR